MIAAGLASTVTTSRNVICSTRWLMVNVGGSTMSRLACRRPTSRSTARTCSPAGGIARSTGSSLAACSARSSRACRLTSATSGGGMATSGSPTIWPCHSADFDRVQYSGTDVSSGCAGPANHRHHHRSFRRQTRQVRTGGQSRDPVTRLRQANRALQRSGCERERAAGRRCVTVWWHCLG